MPLNSLHVVVVPVFLKVFGFLAHLWFACYSCPRMAIVEMPFLGAKINFTHFGEAADFHLRAPLLLVKHD
ncbi:unnamed protein product [Sphagnum troendelagicum]|uniref:Secreted protein n=1 Tax=Sphagnum troendelagicum TaxID=128251 RepID=A0ABP0UPQ7_9BRYO